MYSKSPFVRSFCWRTQDMIHVPMFLSVPKTGILLTSIKNNGVLHTILLPQLVTWVPRLSPLSGWIPDFFWKDLPHYRFTQNFLLTPLVLSLLKVHVLYRVSVSPITHLFEGVLLIRITLLTSLFLSRDLLSFPISCSSSFLWVFNQVFLFLLSDLFYRSTLDSQPSKSFLPQVILFMTFPVIFLSVLT